jgi:hypothetical protein
VKTYGIPPIPAAYRAFNGSKPHTIRAADPHFRDCRVESKRGIIRWMKYTGAASQPWIPKGESSSLPMHIVPEITASLLRADGLDSAIRGYDE